MNDDNGKNSKEQLYNETSQRIAESMLAGYTRKHAKILVRSDLLFRLRVAHALLLEFHHFYFNKQHKSPSIKSQNWLVTQVLQLTSD